MFFSKNGRSLLLELGILVQKDRQKKRRSFSGTESPKVFLVTECNVNGDRRPICTFDCLIKVDEFILENETDNTWFEWDELEAR